MAQDPDGVAPRPREALWQSGRHEVLETIEGNDPDLVVPFAGRPAPTIHRGDEIGRYVVLERIGAGGMGVVFAAYDPQLDRKVALKLLRPEGGGAMRSAGRARLLREAKTTARLNHPNVVTIHDVGTVDDRVFLAMEYIEGQTLSDWQESEPSISEVVRVYVAAGRGLAAAHRAGLVHRDFKPDNVIVRADGHVRVLDFGIAQDQLDVAADAAGIDPALDTAARKDALAALDGRHARGGEAAETVGRLQTAALTQTGTIVGTPAYMAPEQHLGERTDATSDQFSFCVAIWEALYGERPFAGDTRAVLALQVTQGNIRTPEDQRGVPGWLRRCVERGLSQEREHRYESMDALLEALARFDRPPARVRAWWLAGAGVASALGLAAWTMTQEQDPCLAVTQKIERSWNAARASAIESAFSASGLPYAEDVTTRTRMAVDSYVGQWKQSRRGVCEATVVQHVQSAEAMDLRMACLDRRLKELDAQLHALEGAEGESVKRAVEAVDALLPVASCDEVEWLRAELRWPEDPEQRGVAKALEADLIALEAVGRAAGAKRGLPDARALAQRADALGFRPLQARAQLAVAQFELDQHESEAAKGHYRGALLAAQSAGDVEAEIRAWTGLLGVHGDAILDLERGHEVAEHANALLERRGAGSRLEVDFLMRYGEMLDWEGKYDDALVAYQRAESVAREKHEGDLADVLTGKGNVFYGMSRLDDALKTYEEVHQMELIRVGPRHPDVGTILGNLGIVYDDLGQREEAKRHYREGLAIMQAAYGEGDVETATYHNNLAGALYADGDTDAARSSFEKALELWSNAQGHRMDVAMTLANLALVDNDAYKHEDALRRADRALDIYKSEFGEVHRSYASTLHIRAQALAGLGRGAEALELHAKGLDLRSKALGADHLYVGDSHMDYANALLEAGRYEQARVHFERALKLRNDNYDGEHREIVDARVGVASADLGLGRPDEAKAALERGLEYIQRDEGDVGLALAEVRFELARALWDSNGDKARARELATLALARYDKEPEAVATTEPRERMRRWLKTHR